MDPSWEERPVGPGVAGDGGDVGPGVDVFDAGLDPFPVLGRGLVVDDEDETA